MSTCVVMRARIPTTGPTKMLAARVPEDLFDWIDDAAAEAGVTKSHFIMRVLADRRAAALEQVA